LRVGGILDPSLSELLGGEFAGVVASGLQFVHAVLRDVEADDAEFLGEGGGEGESDVAEADDGDGLVAGGVFGEGGHMKRGRGGGGETRKS
jgi:hypothetical protein